VIPNVFLQAVRRLLDSCVFRCGADAVLRALGRAEIARLDRQSPARCQLRILRGLLHKAGAAPFSRDHDFRRIRTEADFRRLVPLRSPAELQRIQSPPAVLDGDKAHRKTLRAAWRTALAFVAAVRPQGRLLSGRLAFLGDQQAGGLPWLARSYSVESADHATADRLARMPMTCIAGPADRIVSVLDQVRWITGRERPAELWPDLTTVLYSRGSPHDDWAPQLRELLGEKVLLLETCFLPEGPVAVEDPRRGCLALLFDHGVYFEFTPTTEAGTPNPTRHGLNEVEPGVVYELALSSPAGVWACRTGVAVHFDRRDPPLFHLVEMPASAAAVDGRKVLTSLPCPIPALHRQIVGIPAAPPEKFAHTLWSTHADRG
jgi:GH3 auxin-responsive promoter